jgi:hypothetical protein
MTGTLRLPAGEREAGSQWSTEERLCAFVLHRERDGTSKVRWSLLTGPSLSVLEVLVMASRSAIPG